MNHPRKPLVRTALIVLAIVVPQWLRAGPENDQGDQALRDMVEAYSPSVADTKGKEIVACGQRATDAILEVVQSAQMRGGGIPLKGTTPVYRPTPINNKWLEMAMTDFADSPDLLPFLRKLAANPDFEGAKRDLDIRIAQYLKAHPEAK